MIREALSAWEVCVYVCVCNQGVLSEKASGEDATQDTFKE